MSTNSDVHSLFARRFTIPAGGSLIIRALPGQESVLIKALSLGTSGLLEVSGWNSWYMEGGVTLPVNGVTAGVAQGNFYPLALGEPLSMQMRGDIVLQASVDPCTFAILFGRTAGANAWR